MTDNAEAQLKTWQNFKQQGIDGQFKLETEIGQVREYGFRPPNVMNCHHLSLWL